MLFRGGLTGTAHRSVAVTLAVKTLSLVVTDGGAASRKTTRWARRVPLRRGQQSSDATIRHPPRHLVQGRRVIRFLRSATDNENGRCTGQSRGTVTLYHCPGSTPPNPFVTRCASGSFTVPDHGDNSYFEITLWATDNGGATATTTRVVNPRTSQVTLTSSPSGLQLVYGGTSRTTPFTVTSIVGSTQTVSALSPQGNQVFSSCPTELQQHNITIGVTTLRSRHLHASVSSTKYISNLTRHHRPTVWTWRAIGAGDRGATDGDLCEFVTFAKGLGAHALSDFVHSSILLEFNATVGVDDEVVHGSVLFQVSSAACCAIQWRLTERRIEECVCPAEAGNATECSSPMPLTGRTTRDDWADAR